MFAAHPRPSLALAGLSLLLAFTALGLFVTHPSVTSKSPGEDFRCLATWDIVVRNAYNDPDGFPPLRGDHIGARCVAKAHRNYRISLGLGSVAVGLTLAATFLGVRGRRTARREPGNVESPTLPR